MNDKASGIYHKMVLGTKFLFVLLVYLFSDIFPIDIFPNRNKILVMV